MKISIYKFFHENTLFISAMAAVLGYGAGWLPLAFPLVLIAGTFLLVLKARMNEDTAVFSPPGMLPLLCLAGLPLIQLIPLPPLVLKFVFPGTWSLYGETIWLAVPGIWMPVSLYPKATLNAFFFLVLNVAVYLLTANLLREKRWLENTVAALTSVAAMTVVISAVLQGYPSFSASGPGRASMAAWPAGSSGISNLQAQLIILFPVLLLFAGYRFSSLRHYTLREKIGEIFNRKSTRFNGLAITTVSLALLFIYILFWFAPIASAVSAAALIFCGFRLFLIRRRRALSRQAFVAAFFLFLAAIFTGDPHVHKKRIDFESKVRTGFELRLLSNMDVGAKLLGKFPVLGTGLGTGPMVRSRLAENGGDLSTKEDIADLADFGVGGGLVGVFLGAWFIVSLLRRIAGRLKEPKGRLADCLLAGSLAGLFAVATLSVLGLMPVAGILWASFLAGLAAAISLSHGVKEGDAVVAEGISARALKAGAVIAMLIVGTWALYALGSRGGESSYPEAWQVRVESEGNHPDPVAASNRARKAGFLDPLEDRYPFAQAELCLAIGKIPAARSQFAAALRRDPLNGKYLQTIGGLEARNGDRRQGEQLILAGLGDRSGLAERQEFYARWLAASARTGEAMQVVREGLTRSPGQTRSFLQMMVLEGISLKKLRQALPNRARCFLDYADYQRESGDPRGANKSYQDALSLAIDEIDADPSIFWQIYRYFSREGNDEAALAALQAGLRLFPLHAEFRSVSGETYQRLGLLSRAAEEYRKALLTDPDNQKAKQGLKELAAD